MRLNLYRYTCTVDNKLVQQWALDTAVPDCCVENAAHPISNLVIIDSIDDQEVTIKGAQDSFKNLRVSPQTPIGNGLTVITHNFCDPCSWHQQSEKITLASATPQVPGDYKTYKLPHKWIIDTEHGRISKEHKLAEDFKVKVYINEALATIPYTFNYDDGLIDFGVNSPLNGNHFVTATYYRATTNLFTFPALPGKLVIIDEAETQHGVNLHLSRFHFHVEAWAYDPQNLPQKKLYDIIDVYKNIKDWLNSSNNKYFSIIPPMDCLSESTLIFCFDYTRAKLLYASQGGEMRMYAVDTHDNNSINNPITNVNGKQGEFSTGTFYCNVENEP